jgi:hypothetical protein
MHRSTPMNSSFRSYTAGGARSAVHQADDSKLMQEMGGNFMHGETRKGVESPQNYGFTSVVMDADKDQDGNVTGSAECIVSFMGGNRSFPVAGPMDDRRHRLKDLDKGDVAMFRTNKDQLQFHLTQTGAFLTGPTNKKLRMQLVDPDQQGSGGGSQQKGQKAQYKNNSKKYFEQTNDNTNLVHDQTINYKTGLHSFQPPEGGGSARAAGGPLVQIFGDKFTNGLGYFMKQVTAAPPTSSMHVTTKGYVDSIIQGLGFNIPSIPSLPMPPLPPGVTLPPGVLPTETVQSAPREPDSTTWVDTLFRRLDAIEARLASLEARMG